MHELKIDVAENYNKYDQSLQLQLCTIQEYVTKFVLTDMTIYDNDHRLMTALFWVLGLLGNLRLAKSCL